MSSTWFINLEERVERNKFNQICGALGIGYAAANSGGNTYYDQRVIGDRNMMGLGGVEIIFGGIKETQSNTPYATALTIRASGGYRTVYEAMKRTTSDLGLRLRFRDISGEWFDEMVERDEVTRERKPIPYILDVFSKIEKMITL